MTWQATSRDSITWDFDKNRQVEGELIERKTDVGPNKSNVYVLKLDDGQLVSLWGTTVLDSQMADKEIGNLLRVTYNGKKQGKNKKPYHDFTVERWIDESELPRAEKPESEDEGLDPDKITFE